MTNTISYIKNRDYSLDSLKYILVSLVVVGHVIEKGIDNEMNHSVFSFIYLFHMPLFVFISGRLSRVCEFRKLLRLIETYLSGVLIYSFIYYLLGNKSRSTDLILDIYKPYFHLWYIFSLFVWRLIINLIGKHEITPPQLGKFQKIIVLIGVSIVMSILFGIFDDHYNLYFSISRTIQFLPFFFLGYYTKNYDLDRLYGKYRFISIVIIFLSIICIHYLTDLTGFLICIKSYSSLGYKYYTGMLLKIIIMIWQTLLAGAFLSLSRKITLFSNLGKNTMVIYIYHLVFVIACESGIKHNYIQCSTLTLLTYSIVAVILLTVISRINFFSNILSPINYINKLCKK